MKMELLLSLKLENSADYETSHREKQNHRYHLQRAPFMAKHEFARELLLLLENDIPERIEMYYQFNKQGFCQLFDEQ